MKRVTIADVAKHAGVSKGTVSHALSGKRPISEATRARIQQVIEELGYQPDRVAQQLAKRNRRYVIGLVLPVYTTEVLGIELQFIASAAKVVNDAGGAFMPLTYLADQRANFQYYVESGVVDGIIVCRVEPEDFRIDVLRRAGLPFVLMGRTIDSDDLAYVDTNATGAISACVEHLVSLGHRSIAYLYRSLSHYDFHHSFVDGFIQACEHYQITPVLQPCGTRPEDGEAALNAVLETHPETTAVILWTDSAFSGVMRAADARGLKIPEGLSVICFDVSASASLLPHQLTLVDIQSETYGVHAAQILLGMLNRDSSIETQVLLDCILKIGKTTVPPRS
jgi:DNA-binding LacI/PurR family transcriptional regulator